MACVIQEVQGLASEQLLPTRGFRAQGKHPQMRQVLPPGKPGDPNPAQPMKRPNA